MGVLDKLNSQQMANLKAFNLSAMQGNNNTAGLTASLQTQPSMLGIGSNPATPQQFFGLDQNTGGGNWFKNLNGNYSKWAEGESFLGGGISNGTLVNAGMGALNMGVNMLAGQNHSAVGDVMQTVGGLASNIPGVGGLIGAGVGVVGGLVNAAFGSHINEEFVNQTQMQANAVGNRAFNANTNADVLNDWGNYTEQSLVNQSDVGSDGWFSSKASDKRKELNQQIQEANRRQLANFNVAAENVDTQNDFRIMQNMAAYGGPINSFRKYYDFGGSLYDTPQFFSAEPQIYDDGGYLSQAKALIRQNEGWREKPYKDAPKGKNWRSVGYGFNDSGFRDKYPEGISKHYEHGITKKQAEEELDYFLNKAEKQLKSIYGKQWNDFTDSQKAAILDTYYQRPASVAKGSRFYKAVTSGEDAGKYLGVAGYDKRNKVRQGVFGGSQDYINLGIETGNTESNPSTLQEVTPFTPVVHDLDLSGITPTQAKALELNLASPTFDLSMFGKPMTAPTQQAVPTVGTVEDFLASYGDFDNNLFANGGELNIKGMNIYDFGGGLTHGSDWDTGINWVNEGGSHGENPLGGVQMGVDEQGVPNLVEEGEAIWNGDYVFSKRMKVPKKLAKKYGLGSDMTFADAIAKLTKDSEERPLSNIDRATNDHILGEFADSQEELRMAKAQRAMDKEVQLQDDFLTGFQFGLGGGLFAEGGGIHIDSSKRGTFKAQASKMGMGVQEAASHILANKENYSPAMVRKANFARNASHWHEDGGDLFSNPFAYGGELGNVFAGEGEKANSLKGTYRGKKLPYEGAFQSKASYARDMAAAGFTDEEIDAYMFDEGHGKSVLGGYGNYRARTEKYMKKYQPAYYKVNQDIKQKTPNTAAKSASNNKATNAPFGDFGQMMDTFGTSFTPTFSLTQPTDIAPNRGNGNKGKAAVTETPAITPEETGAASTRRGSQSSGRGRGNSSGSATRSSVGPTGLNYYGTDPIETFKYWDKETGDYDEGYRDFIENKLNEDWITRVMNGQYGDMSRYKGANKINPTVEQAWQLGLDKKNSDWHKAMAAAYDEYQKGIDPKTGKANTPVVEWPDENWEFDPYSEGWEARRGISTEPVTTKPDDKGITKSPFKPKQTWTRYAPIAMNALFGLKEMLTPADYGNADAIMAAAYQAGSPVSIGTEYIGDYRKRDPFDETYLMNIINQNSRAANRNFMNISGGNRAAAMSGILANDLVTQRSLAEAARQAYLANRTDDAQVSEFNRGTNIFNAQAQNQRNQFLAQLNSQRQNAMLSGIAQGARLRQAIKDQRDAAIAANLSAFAQGLGDIGWENYGTNQVNSLFENGYTPYWLNGKGNVNFRDNV